MAQRFKIYGLNGKAYAIQFFFVLLVTALTTYLLACTAVLPTTIRTIPQIKVMDEKGIEEMVLEQYVASVLAGEVFSTWPIEALKAQAIAARTYALKRMKERQQSPFHVRNSVSDQVLRHEPDDIFLRAAKESMGLVVIINGSLAETSFHSTCGGKTTDSGSVWGYSHPHLRGGKCGFCELSPTYEWQESIPKKVVEKNLGQKISKIKIISRSNDGRVQGIKIFGSKNTFLQGKDFRKILGANHIKSTFLKEIKVFGSKILFIGKGFGHGVGMCQYGALGMAKDGRRFHEILSHYYPGTKLVKVY